MSKAVLISIRPEWCDRIASGIKTVEVRKTRPKLEPPFKCYIYCTKFKYGELLCFPQWKTGKVIGEFVCDKIIETVTWRIKGKTGFLAKRTEDEASLPQRSCLTIDEIVQYAGSENRCIYGWHISELVIYDTPKELSEYTGLRETKFGFAPVCMTRAPQSWCYVEEG